MSVMLMPIGDKRARARFLLLMVVAVLLMLAASVFAQNTDFHRAMIRYDVDSTTATACRMEGIQNSTFLNGSLGAARIKTAGSNTTVTSETAASSALAPILARDVIAVRPLVGSLSEPFGAGFAAVVTVKTDADTVTVDPAVDWSAGYAYSYFRPVCGTDSNAGWIGVSGATRITMTIQYDQGDMDALAWRFECKQGALGSVPIIVYPSEGDGCGNAGTQSASFCEFATAGATANFTWEEFGSWSACRIVFKEKSTDASDAGANLERVTGSISVARSN